MYKRVTKTSIKTIRQDDPMFMLKNGLYLAPRAGFEFSDSIPNTYRDVIMECLTHGWLKPVAYMYAKEYTMDALR